MSVLVPDIFGLKNVVKYTNEMTDDQLYTQPNIISSTI